ncbi:MAG: 2-phospho-L-lactate guanylyltransferase [Actinomycetota bacterium]|jgi:2-phospho-L-lactate/phosphoenolpyruvate guanylyltransferase|nr:2-phospho-L-lactate guanylyltransferase [Actinomycetota bacterium]
MALERSPREHTGPDPVVLVPIKDFRQAKHRLAERLSAEERQALARSMATQVVRAAGPLDVRVVCNDHEVATWAESVGAGVEWVDVVGLNEAITAAVEQLDRDILQVMICHADLPRARSLDGLSSPGRATIVPDRHLDGTNVMVVPTGHGFVFQYGAGSLHAHIRETLRLGLDLDLRQIPDLQWDVDTPDDLDAEVDAAPEEPT